MAQPSASPSLTATPVKTTPSPSPTTTKPAPLPPSSPHSVPKLDATVSISIAAVDPSSGELVVGGYVTGVFENGGACAYSATSPAGGAPLSVHTTGVANVDTTSCGSTSFPKDQLRAGTYTVTLTYTNGHGAAVSSPVTVKVTS